MRHRLWVVVFATFFAAIGLTVYRGNGYRRVTLISVARAADEAGGKSGGPPPLVVNKDKPLLLLDGPAEGKKGSAPSDEPKADNSACHCCHTNYETEWLAVTHAKADVGCIKCHGECLAHRDDEDNVTPPDIMYWPEKIGPACAKCHETHEAPATEVIARWQECCPAKEDPKTIVCTDCHGKHRLKFRTVWWDKKTRKMIVRKEGTVKYNPDYTKKKPKKAE